MENKKFWEQEEWLNKTKETNEVLYNQILDFKKECKVTKKYKIMLSPFYATNELRKIKIIKLLREVNKNENKNMRDVIESGTEWIEDPVDLNLDIDKLRFESIEDLTIEEMVNQKVYDLEVENQHNYIVDGLGLVHNGGGK